MGNSNRPNVGIAMRLGYHNYWPSQADKVAPGHDPEGSLTKARYEYSVVRTRIPTATPMKTKIHPKALDGCRDAMRAPITGKLANPTIKPMRSTDPPSSERPRTS